MGKGTKWITKHYYIEKNSPAIHSVKAVSGAG